MIWHCQQGAGGDNDGLVATISAELEAVYPERSDVKQEIAQAVAAFIRRQHGEAAIACEYLLLLISRALWAIGEAPTARRFIETKGAEWKVEASFADMALVRDLSLPHWRMLLGSRAVRPISSMAYGTIWIVDMRRIVDPVRTGLELTVFRVIDAVIDRIAGLWDHSKGQGILGLRHLDAAAAAMLGCALKCRKSAAMALEIREQCSLRLQSIGTVRGWSDVPEVMSLDL